jgi:ABC-type sugar transport system permease subunit
MAQAQLSIQQPFFTQRRRLALAGAVFVLPSMVLFVAFLAIPLIYSLIISFSEWSMMRGMTWIGLENYQKLLRDEIFFRSLRNTAVFTILFVPLVTFLSLGSAALLNQKIGGKSLFKALIFIPVITPSIVVGVVWTYVFQPELGLLNNLLRMLNLPTSLWLGSQEVALPALVIVTLWQRFGWFMILFLAGLQDIPIEVKEAAAIDGASPWQSFWQVTVPLLRPTVVLVTILAAISAFQVFDLIFIMTEGGPAYATQTLSYYIYTQAFRSFDMGYAAAMSYVLFAILLVLSIIQMRIFRPVAEH